MQKVKSFGKKSLSLFLALMMLASCLTAGFMSASAYSPPSGTKVSSQTKYGKDEITYNNLDWPVYNDEQVATALLDYLDEILPSLNINMVVDLSVAGKLTVDLRSVNAVFNTLRAVNAMVGKFSGLLGSLGQLNLSAANGVSRDSKTSIEIIQALMQCINDNRNLVRWFLEGTLNLGSLVEGSILKQDLYSLLGGALGVSLDRNNVAYSLVKPLLVKLLYPDTESQAYKDAMNKTIDNYIFDDVLAATFGTKVVEGATIPSIKFYDNTINPETGLEYGWTNIFEGLTVSQNQSAGTMAFNAIKAAWGTCLKRLLATVKYVPGAEAPTENPEAPADQIDVTTLFGKLLYDPATGHNGVLNLNLKDSTLLTDPDFNFNAYTSIADGFNDFLGYILPYFLPKYDFAANWIMGHGTANLMGNAVKLLGYICDSVDTKILADIGGAANLTANNMEAALMPFAKALLKHLAPVVHDDTLAKVVDFESLAKYGAMIYASQILPENTYDENDDYLTVVRDIMAYQMGNVIPLYDKNGNIYDVYANDNSDSLWDVLNYVLCYYGQDRGVGALLNVNISRSNTLWQNIDNICAVFPVLGQLINGTDTNVNSQDVIQNLIIGNVMDGKFEPIIQKLLDICNSNVFSDRAIMEVLYTNLKNVVKVVAGQDIAPAYQSSPFDNFLQKNNIAPFVENLISRIWAERDGMWTGLCWALQTISSFVPGFLTNLSEAKVGSTSVSLEKSSFNSLTGISTSAVIKNNSTGNDRARTVGVDENGNRTVIYENKYKALVKSFTIYNQDGTVCTTLQTDFIKMNLGSGQSVKVGINGSVAAPGTYSIKVVYDIVGEDGVTSVIKDRTSITFFIVSTQRSHFDSIYEYSSANSRYEFTSANRVDENDWVRVWGNYIGQTGTGSARNNYNIVWGPKTIVLEPDSLNNIQNYTVRIAGHGSGGKNIDGFYALKPGTTDFKNADNALVSKDANGNWVDAEGNVILNAGGTVTWQAVHNVAKRETGIPGISFSLGFLEKLGTDSNYYSFLQWDGVTPVTPGEYTIKMVMFNEATSAVTDIKIIVADTSAVLANQDLPVGSDSYIPRASLHNLYNECMNIYGTYEAKDFTTGTLNEYDDQGNIIGTTTLNGAECYANFETALKTALSDISDPITLSNALTIGTHYTQAYKALDDARKKLMATVDVDINRKVSENVNTLPYIDVDYVRVTYNRMIDAANAAYALPAGSSSFVVDEAIRQFKLAESQLVFRKPCTVKLDAEIARQSMFNPTDIAPTRWNDYQKVLTKATAISNAVATGTTYDGKTVKQSDVNTAMWDLMVMENSLDLPDRMLYNISNIEVTKLPNTVQISKGAAFDPTGLTVVANLTDIEPDAGITGTTLDISSSVTLSPVDTSTVGVKTVTVTYTDMIGRTYTTQFDVTVVAKTYTVKFYAEEEEYATEGNLVNTQTVEEGGAAVDPINLPEVAKAIQDLADIVGMEFAGWSVSFDNITSDLKVYPTFGYNNYTITYHVDADTTITGNYLTSYNADPSSDYYATGIVLPAASKAGYNFVGWYTEEGLVNAITTIAATAATNYNLYPRFEAVASGSAVTGYISVMSSGNDVVSSHANVKLMNTVVTLYAEDGKTVVTGVDPAAVNADTGYFQFDGVADGTYVLVIRGTSLVERAISLTVKGSDVAVSTADRQIGLMKGDFDGNKFVNYADYTSFANFLGKSVATTPDAAMYDFDGNGFINYADYTAFINVLGKNSNSYNAWVIQ